MADDTFDYAIITLLGFPSKSQPYRALRNESIDSIYKVALLVDSDINNLWSDELDENDKVKMTNQPLKLFHQNAIRMMGNYFRYLLDQHGNIVLTDKGFMNAATHESWTNFRVKPDIALSYSTPTKVPIPSVVTPSHHTTSPGDLIFQSFLRGAKRDKKDYDILKDERQYDNWQRSFVAQARAHHVDRVLNPSFTPIDDNDAMMFRLQQQFLYTVLDATLKTDMGKTLVRRHQFTGNAQQVWTEFTVYMKQSTRAKHSASKLLTYLTTSKYDKNWKGTAQGYILYWLARASEYDSMILDPDSRLNERQKQNLLQNAVNNISELRQVRINCDIIDSENPDLPSISYQRYTNLLQSAAESLDAHVSDYGGNKSTQNQQMFFTDTQTNDDSTTEWNNTDMYNVDTYLSNVMARNTPVQSRTPRINVTTSDNYPFNVIPRESWLKIPQDVRDQLTVLRKGKTNGNAYSTNIINTFTDYGDYDCTINSTNQSDSTDMSINNDTTLIDYSLNKTHLSEPAIQQIVNQTMQSKRQGSSTKSSISSSSSNNADNKEVIVNGITYISKVNFTCIEYRINSKISTMSGYSLVDRGANGGLLGDDVRILETSTRLITITGIDNHQIKDLPICTGAGLGMTNKGPAIFILNQYAYLGQGKTLHSSAQLEAFKINVQDKSQKLGGGQKLITPDGYLIPLDFIGGLAYFKLRPPTDQELSDIPHIVLTSDIPWDPTCVDNIIDPDTMDWYSETDIQTKYGFHPFNQVGDYKESTVNELISVTKDCASLHHSTYWQINEYKSSTSTKPNYTQLQPYFGYCSPEIIEHTFKNTTQFVRSLHLYGNMRKHYKSRFPAFNVTRRNEPVATDTIISTVPSIGCGSKCAQIFVGRESLVTDVYGMKTDKEFVGALEDNIRRRGAMEKLILQKSGIKCKIFSAHSLLTTGRVNHTTNIKIMPNVITQQLKLEQMFY